MESWKQFQGTELGGLMSQIYGNDSKPKINYPKIKVKENKPTEPFIPGGAKPTQTDPRKATRRDVKVAVPKPASKIGVTGSMIDYVPHRKPEAAIKEEIDEIQMRKNYYRPAYVKPISSESEKDRLSQICEYKGGKALPSELIAPSRDTPLELKAKSEERERIEKVYNKRSGISDTAKPAIRGPVSHEEEMIEQIISEIEERREYIRDMASMGSLSAADESRLKAEISKRVVEIERMQSLKSK